MVGMAYSSHAAASSTVVAGEKLKMPLSSVPYQDVGGTAVETSKARLFRPGSTPASWRSCTPYARTPAATKIKKTPVQVKKRVKLIFSAPRYIP